MSLAILFSFLCIHHVSDINISIIRSLRLCCWITTSVVLLCKDGGFSVSVNLWCLVVMDILMSETCWVHKKENKIASDIKLVFYSSTITMVYGLINIILKNILYRYWIYPEKDLRITSINSSPQHVAIYNRKLLFCRVEKCWDERNLQ
jgi:hypothetical protein